MRYREAEPPAKDHASPRGLELWSLRRINACSRFPLVLPLLGAPSPQHLRKHPTVPSCLWSLGKFREVFLEDVDGRAVFQPEKGPEKCHEVVR